MSLGQVASQTIDAISLTNGSRPCRFSSAHRCRQDYAVQMPEKSAHLKHPSCHMKTAVRYRCKASVTKPQRKHMEHAERFLDIDDLVSQGLEGIERILIE